MFRELWIFLIELLSLALLLFYILLATIILVSTSEHSVSLFKQENLIVDSVDTPSNYPFNRFARIVARPRSDEVSLSSPTELWGTTINGNRVLAPSTASAGTAP